MQGLLTLDTSKLDSVNLSLDLNTLANIVRIVICDIVTSEGDYNKLNEVNPVTQLTLLDDRLSEILNIYTENNNVGTDETGAVIYENQVYQQLYELYCTLYTELYMCNELQHLIIMAEQFNSQSCVLYVQLVPTGIPYTIKMSIPVLNMTL